MAAKGPELTEQHLVQANQDRSGSLVSRFIFATLLGGVVCYFGMMLYLANAIGGFQHAKEGLGQAVVCGFPLIWAGISVVASALSFLAGVVVYRFVRRTGRERFARRWATVTAVLTAGFGPIAFWFFSALVQGVNPLGYLDNSIVGWMPAIGALVVLLVAWIIVRPWRHGPVPASAVIDLPDSDDD